MTKRNAGIAGATLLVLVAAIWLAASPYLALRTIRDALQRNDAATLNEHIDYDALRSSLKTQIAEAAAKNAGGPNANPAAVAMMIGFGDKMIDALIQPESLTGLLAGKRGAASQAGGSGSGLNAKDIHVHRTSITRFEVTNGTAAAATAVFQLEGLTWKLVGMDIPAGPAS